MVDNLRFELGNGMTLTTQDTDVSSNRTVWFTQNGQQGGAALAGMSGNFKTPPNQLTRDNTSSTISPNMNAWAQMNANIGICATGVESGATTRSLTGCGFHYNFFTAAAGTWNQNQNGSDVPGSICPAGWRLIRNSGRGQGNIDDGDFGVLSRAYGGQGRPGVDDADTSLWGQNGAFRNFRSGRYDVINAINNNAPPALVAIGGIQDTWTTFTVDSPFSAVWAWDIGVRGFGHGIDPRHNGLTIRCLLR